MPLLAEPTGLAIFLMAFSIFLSSASVVVLAFFPYRILKQDGQWVPLIPAFAGIAMAIWIGGMLAAGLVTVLISYSFIGIRNFNRARLVGRARMFNGVFTVTALATVAQLVILASKIVSQQSSYTIAADMTQCLVFLSQLTSFIEFWRTTPRGK